MSNMKRLLLLRKELEDKRFGIQRKDDLQLELLQIIAEELCMTNLYLERIPSFMANVGKN